jgi:hypothetical protein
MGGAIPSIPKMVTSVIGGDRSPSAVSGAIKEIQTTSPTTAEVSQATATDATGIKRRRRGRSPTILTGAAGVSEGATLGTPTLLG